MSLIQWDVDRQSLVPRKGRRRLRDVGVLRRSFGGCWRGCRGLRAGLLAVGALDEYSEYSIVVAIALRYSMYVE